METRPTESPPEPRTGLSTEPAAGPDAGASDQIASDYEGVIPDRTACAVKLGVFEGPLDLLLHLIRINEVDIVDIPIALISEQYLEYLELMRTLDIDIAGEYLVMAATLAHIKSAMLLPPSETEEGLEEDPREELARRLAEYALFKEAGQVLGRRAILGRDVFAGALDRGELPEPEQVLSVDLFQLLEALRHVLERIPAEEHHHEITLERVTLQDRMVYAMDRLRGVPDGALLFEDLLLDEVLNRHRVVITFLAILELAKIQALRIFQNRNEDGLPFGPVRVRLAIEVSASEDAEGEEAADERSG